MKYRLYAICLSVLLSALIMCSCGEKKQEPNEVGGHVAEEYAYNTEIIRSENAPVPGAADISKLTDYQEGAIDGVSLPFEVPDTPLVIDSVGAYNGQYVEDSSMDACAGVPAVVVRNTSDQIVSFASFKVRYGEGEDAVCSFRPTNLKAGCSALVLTEDKTLQFDKMTAFEIVKSSAILIDELTMIDDMVGVSYDNGKIVLTNLKERSLGTVYIRYKFITDANAYLGGVTCSVLVENAQPYKTYLIPAGNFDPERCEIICVENDDNTDS